MFDARAGRPWSAEEIGERLTLAFAQRLNSQSALLAEGGRFVHITTGKPCTASDFIGLAERLLGRTDDCECFMAWARAQAGIGPSFKETCRTRGWNENTALRARRVACGKLARMLNALADCAPQRGRPGGALSARRGTSSRPRRTPREQSAGSPPLPAVRHALQDP